MTYHQITSEERYILATLRKQGLNQSEIARELGRHRSTISRELKRNSARFDGHYRPSKAIERTAGRRSRSRRNQRFTRSCSTTRRCPASGAVEPGADLRPAARLALDQSRDDLPSRLARSHARRLAAHLSSRCSQTTAQTLRRLRQPRPPRRQDDTSASDLAPPSCAPRSATGRSIPSSARAIATASSRRRAQNRLRRDRQAPSPNARNTPITVRCASCAGIRSNSKPSPLTTAPSSTTTPQLEQATGAAFYFATPHHSWERGTNENTNGLIRQYVPKGTSMAKLSQQRCNAIARALNNRPRKRLGFKTPQECLHEI